MSAPAQTPNAAAAKSPEIAIIENGGKPAAWTGMTLLQLFSRCLFRHGNMLRTRDEAGHLVLQCAECGEVTRLFEQPVIKGPKHDVEPVKGAPIVKVKRGSRRQFTFPRSA